MLQYAKQNGLSDQDMKGTKLAYPTITFDNRLMVDLVNNKIEILYRPLAHHRQRPGLSASGEGIIHRGYTFQRFSSLSWGSKY
jgi:hypothetical protein